MSNPKGTTLPNLISMYFVMLAVYCIDIFLFKSDLTVLGDAFYSRFISFVILFLYIRASKDTLSILGISKKTTKITAGIVYGVLFSVVPLFIITVAEGIYYSVTDTASIYLNFSPPSLSFVRSEENMTPVAAVVIYIFTTFFGSAFKEFFFRGFLLKKLKKIMDFGWANIIQAVLYMSFTMALLLRNLVSGYYDTTTASLGVFIIAFYFIHETIAGIKWGLMTRISGSTYIATVDHTLFVFLSNSIFITERPVTWSFMIHMLAIQLLSLVFTLVYYKIGMNMINKKKAVKEAREEAERLEIEERRKAKREKSIKNKTDGMDKISPASFKKIVLQTDSNTTEIPSEEEILSNRKTIEDTLTAPLDEAVEDNAEIDKFLKKVTREMNGEHNNRHGEITEGFDTDDFLEAYSKSDGKLNYHKHQSHHHGHHRGHHRHHETVKQTQTSAVLTTKTQKEITAKPKLTFRQKLQSLGGIDLSSSNDLI